MKKNEKIDFVILWVDGADPKWLDEKKQYKPDLDVSDSIIRFRDWDNLKYWFRGVEKYAPWVNKIYFVTYGHLPKFLNINHKKLVIVNHKDFINSKFLPTYNSNVLDLNLCFIKGLSEKFVYFNDDTFITNHVSKTDFFKNDLPVDEYAEIPTIPNKTIFPYSMFNNAFIINNYFSKIEVYRKHPLKYFNPKYGINMFRTINCLPYKNFCGFYSAHLPIPFLKSYYYKLWDLEKEKMEETSFNKFRTKNDITSYLIREFQFLEGSFYPRSKKVGKYFILSDNNDKIVTAIKNKKYKMICINDQDEKIDYEKTKKEINDAFEQIFPNKSAFER